MTDKEDDLTVLKCWHCDGGFYGNHHVRCWHCAGSGNLFWVSGRAYPYTPEGETYARRALARL